MDTTNNDAAFWIAGYTDYLRDVVGRPIRRDCATCPPYSASSRPVPARELPIGLACPSSL
jgi:hypothetical protein